MLYSAPSPRIPTYRPSPPVVRVMETPVIWRSESATSASGKRPSSSALIESRTMSASCLISRDLPRLALYPVTTTVWSFESSAAGLVGVAAVAGAAGWGGVCAWASAGAPGARIRPAACSAARTRHRECFMALVPLSCQYEIKRKPRAAIAFSFYFLHYFE